jgi:peptidylprolyl isomerase
MNRLATSIAVVTCLGSLAACQRPDKPQARFVVQTPPGAKPPAVPGELRVKEVTVGEGEEVKPGKRVVVAYEARLMSGPRIDSTHDRGKPAEFVVGSGSVIKGLDQGVVGMRPGGRRQLRVPADKAYGTRGVGGVVPPGSELVYDVQLLEVRPE